MSDLPDPKRKDGPPDGKAVVRTYTVTVAGVQHDPDDADEYDEAGDIERALSGSDIVADVEHTGTEDA